MAIHRLRMELRLAKGRGTSLRDVQLWTVTVERTSSYAYRVISLSEMWSLSAGKGGASKGSKDGKGSKNMF